MPDIRNPTSRNDSLRETPHGTPEEGLGANATTREGAAQPRADHREVPMPDRPLDTQAARGATTTGRVRYILPISIALAVIGFFLALTLS
jgi:hypothetical protein